MADRYVIPAGGASNTTATWSATDGGAGGASIPVSGDTAYCTALSGNLVLTGTQSFNNLICTGYTGTMSGAGALNILGDTFILSAGMTLTANQGLSFTGANAVGDVTITTAGQSLGMTVTLNGVGKVFKLGDALTMPISRGITLTNGEFDRQGFAVSIATFTATNTNTKTISLGGSAPVTCLSSFRVTGTGTTFTAPDVLKLALGSAASPATAIIDAGVALKKVEISRAAGAIVSGFQLAEAGGDLSIEWLEFVDAANANWLGAKIVLPADITIDKMSLPEGTELVSSANGTQRTITTTTGEISGDSCMLRDIVIASPSDCYFTNSIDLGNNGGDLVFNNFGPNTHEIVGVTYDNTGSILGSCICTATKEVGGIPVVVGTTVSDAVTGAYTIGTPDNDAAAYTVTWTKLGSPRGDAMCGITPTVP